MLIYIVKTLQAGGAIASWLHRSYRSWIINLYHHNHCAMKAFATFRGCFLSNLKLIRVYFYQRQFSLIIDYSWPASCETRSWIGLQHSWARVLIHPTTELLTTSPKISHQPINRSYTGSTASSKSLTLQKIRLCSSIKLPHSLTYLVWIGPSQPLLPLGHSQQSLIMYCILCSKSVTFLPFRF